MEFLDVASFSFDEEKNLQIEVRENTRHVLEADTVIFAIGQWPEIPEGFGLDTTGNNLIELDSYTQSTSRDGIFAAGDAVSGATSVIESIASGRKTAITLDRFLGGSGNIDVKLAPPSELKNCLGSGEGFAFLNRCEDSCILPEERLKSFSKVLHDMDEEIANYESKRCLQCDLRLKITPVKFWGNY